MFSYDRKTGDLLNYWQHYINITKANDGAKPTLELEYSPLSPYHGGGGGGGDPPGYGLKDLSQASWDWLDNMIVDNTTMKLLFERYYFVSYPGTYRHRCNTSFAQVARLTLCDACSCAAGQP